MIRARIITYFLSFTRFSDLTEKVPVRLVGMEIWRLLIPNFVILNVGVIYSFMRSVFGSNFPHLMVNICLLVTIAFLLILYLLIQLITFLL